MMKKILSVFILGIMSLGLLAQTDILPPQLVAPSNGDDDQMPNAELDWLPVSGIGYNVMYEVQIDTNDQFTNPQVFETNESAYRMSQLRFGTTYYWRVRASDDVGTSDWSETFSFITFFVVDLDGPDDGEEGITPKFELEWKGRIGSKYITGVTFFDYEISVDTNFADVFQHGSVPYALNTMKYSAFTQQLLFDQTFFWRVRARHESDTTEWSEVWSFHTIVKPTLTSPANGATGQMLNVQLKWPDVTGSFEYVYELCTDSTFSSPCMNVADSNVATAQGLTFGKTYYWRVKASHTLDTSDYSDRWSFETINTVNLVSPANGSHVPDIYPTLEWEAQTGIGGYMLYLDVDANFPNPEIHTMPAAENSFDLIQPAITGTTYYWKVRAYENGDTTEWSPTWNFISGESQGVFDNSAEYNMSIYPNPCDDILNLKIFANEQIAASVSILNLLGQTIKEKDIMLTQGINKNNMQVSDLESGIYMIRIKSGDSYITQRFVINR